MPHMVFGRLGAIVANMQCARMVAGLAIVWLGASFAQCVSNCDVSAIIWFTISRAGALSLSQGFHTCVACIMGSTVEQFVFSMVVSWAQSCMGCMRGLACGSRRWPNL